MLAVSIIYAETGWLISEITVTPARFYQLSRKIGPLDLLLYLFHILAQFALPIVRQEGIYS